MGLLNTKAALAALALGLLAQSPAMAVLTTGDSLDPSLPNLVVDTSTGLQWLSPYATRDHSYNDAYVRGLAGQYGLRYATFDEALYLINSNFGFPTTSIPGNTAGFQSAQSFLNTFGTNFQITCGSQNDPGIRCGGTLGLTSTPGAAPNSHRALGMLRFEDINTGYMIAYNSWLDRDAITQTGSWLIRDPSIVPSATTMIGDSLTFSRNYPTVNDFYLPPQSRVVRNGSDDELQFSYYTRVNADANDITFEVLADSLYIGTGSVFDGYRVSGFSKDIDSVALVDNTTGHALMLDHDARSITVNIPEPQLPAGSSFRLNVQFAAPSAVPEAPTAWMMAAALLPLAGRALKRRQRGGVRA